jgi:hypothetical protein
VAKNYKRRIEDRTAGEVNAVTVSRFGRDRLIGLIASYRLPIFSRWQHIRNDIETLWADGSIKEGVSYFVGKLKATGRENPREVVVPIVIREGKMLDPAIMLVNGDAVVMSLESVDGLFRGEEFPRPIPDRTYLYAPPPLPGLIVPTRLLPDFYDGRKQ